MALGVAWLLISARVVHAEPMTEPEVNGREVIVVVGNAPRGGPGDLDGNSPTARDRDRAITDAPLVTIIHPDDRLGEQAGLGSALASTVGAAVRSFGGLGSFTSLSVRGAASGHTAIVVDGVPLSRVGTVSADLGRFELDAYDQIELYRGAVPILLGGAGVGGALILRTKLGPTERGEKLVLSVGTGSFEARHARVRYGDTLGNGRKLILINGGYRGARGDYSYFSNGGTNLNPNDDTFVRRLNNGFDQGDLSARLGDADGQSAMGVRVAMKRQGIPGPANAQSLTAHLSTLGVVLDGNTSVPLGARTVGQLQTYGAIERQAYVDRDNEVGVGPQDRRYLLGVLGGSTGFTRSFGALDAHQIVAAVDLRRELYSDDDLLGERGTKGGGRVAGGLAVATALSLLGGKLALEPGARLDVVRTAAPPDAIAPVGNPPVPHWDTPVSPRLGARVLAAPDLAIKASAGYYARLPTALELFGDRGFIVGTPDLVAETGPSLEAGAVWAPAQAHGSVDRVLLEAAAFISWPHNTIALVPITGNAARALNLGDARLRGVELSASGRLGKRVTVVANYTRLDTVQNSPEPSTDGKPLPRRPGHTLYARVDGALRLGPRLLSPWLDVDFASSSNLDGAGLRLVPGRTLVGAGLKFELSKQLLLGVEVRNLSNSRVVQLPLANPPRPDLSSVPTAVSDVAGYPLPGRTFYFTLIFRA